MRARRAQDVKSLTKLAVKPRLRLPRTDFVVPNQTFGAASAIAAARASAQLA